MDRKEGAALVKKNKGGEAFAPLDRMCVVHRKSWLSTLDGISRYGRKEIWRNVASQS